MRKISIIFVVLVFAVNIFGQEKYKTYSNARFAYSILYPSDLKIQPPPENDDGRTFVSADKQTEMRVWGEFNALFLGLKEKYEADLKSFDGEITYKALLKNGYVISGVKDGKIFYQKTLFRGKEKESDAIFYTFTIEYEKAERKKFDSAVKRISGSFKFDPKANV